MTAYDRAGGCFADVMLHSSTSYHQEHAFFAATKHVQHCTRAPPIVQYLTFPRSMDHRVSKLLGM